MERIASFCVDHTKLNPGIYVSRIDDDITTFDLRFKRPNHPPFISCGAMHSLEHLFATIARNSEHKEKIIYFGPMGCQTGFYFLVRSMSNETAISLIKDIISKISEWEGEIPGISEEECGNYLLHDLDDAKKEAAEFLKAIKNWDVKDTKYK
ncbi:MAG: S-ribosylhomocysteine lyase [Bacillota bacterium]|nr:S-ribosylhomocysteine lyase [Bacillota bacterium]